MSKMFIAIIAGAAFYAFSPSVAQAKLIDNLGLNKHQAKQAAKAARKALGKHNHHNGGNPGAVSPCTTFIAQLLCSQEPTFLFMYDAYQLGQVGKHKVKHFLRRGIRLDFRVAGHKNRQEFKNLNGVGRRGVIHDYMAAFFQGGVLPIYF
ncbi:MAG: hypothetical protein U0903_17600 [Planctomycetales bacterium]